MHPNRIPTYPQVSCYSNTYCRKSWISGIVHSRWAHTVRHHWFFLVIFQFLTIQFRMSNTPTMTTASFSIVFVCPLRTAWFTRSCFDRQRLRLLGWCMFHDYTRLSRCFRCLQPFFDRTHFLKQTVHLSLVVIKRLPDIDKLLVLRSYCCQDLPCCSSIGMSCDLRRRSPVFMPENSFSNLTT